MRVVFGAAALLSPFMFPYPFTMLLSFVASLYFPPLGFLVGVLTDFLYYTPSAFPVPLATVLGIFISVGAFFMQRFLKARIMN